jgi:hypothetical protein
MLLVRWPGRPFAARLRLYVEGEVAGEASSSGGTVEPAL